MKVSWAPPACFKDAGTCYQREYKCKIVRGWINGNMETLHPLQEVARGIDTGDY